MDFVIGLLVFINWKSKTYNLILVIVNQLTKIVYYKLVKVTINALSLAKVMIDMVLRWHSLLNSVASNCGLVSNFYF